MNLYLVICRGLQPGLVSYGHGVAYVVAESADEAYQRLKMKLERASLGTPEDRAMATIKLVAEDADYPGCGTSLLLPKGSAL